MLCQGPCYDVLHKSSFVPQVTYLQTPQSLKYPVFNIEHQNLFNEIQKNLDTLKQMNLPVRENVDYKHHFNEIERKMESLRDLQGKLH